MDDMIDRIIDIVYRCDNLLIVYESDNGLCGVKLAGCGTSGFCGFLLERENV